VMNAFPSQRARDDAVQWTEFGIPIRNLWYMLLYAWNELSLKRLWSDEDAEIAPTLDALLASILAKFVQQRLRIGLGCDYMDESLAIRGVKGRIDFTTSVKGRTLDRGMAVCDFQQYSANVPKNQIIRSVLARLVQTGDFGVEVVRADELRHQLRWLVRLLDGIDLIELKPDFVRSQQQNRNDHDYRLMLAICELILQRQMPTHEGGLHKISELERTAMVFHRIYEKFIANFYGHHLREWIVTPQKRLGWYEEDPNPHLPAMHPDLVLQEKSTGRIIMLDTKFTAQSLDAGRWGQPAFNSPHLYQIYTYLKSQEHMSEQFRCCTGILLYPTVHQNLSEAIRLQDHTVRIETIDLTLPWQDVEHSLLELISKSP
jgi:5-methylcytosine-specific restriction enzyme subunit McrC